MEIRIGRERHDEGWDWSVTHTQRHTHTGTDTDTHAQISTHNQTRKNTCLNAKKIVSMTQESQGRETAAKVRTLSICSDVVESLTCLLSVGDHVFIADGILT